MRFEPFGGLRLVGATRFLCKKAKILLFKLERNQIKEITIVASPMPRWENVWSVNTPTLINFLTSRVPANILGGSLRHPFHHASAFEPERVSVLFASAVETRNVCCDNPPPAGLRSLAAGVGSSSARRGLPRSPTPAQIGSVTIPPGWSIGSIHRRIQA